MPPYEKRQLIYITAKGKTDFKATHFGLPYTYMYLIIFFSEKLGLNCRLYIDQYQLEPYQDLDPNCLQRLSADEKSRH